MTHNLVGLEYNKSSSKFKSLDSWQVSQYGDNRGNKMPIALILTAMPLISLCANRFFCMHTSISIISMRTITLRDRKTAKRILKILESQNISHSIPPNNSRHIRHAAINYCLHFCGWLLEWDGVTTYSYSAVLLCALIWPQ